MNSQNDLKIKFWQASEHFEGVLESNNSQNIVESLNDLTQSYNNLIQYYEDCNEEVTKYNKLLSIYQERQSTLTKY